MGSIIHFHDPELIIIGYLLKRRGKKVIYYVHEDYMMSIKQKNCLPYFVCNPLTIIICFVEKELSKLFDVVIAEKYYIEFLING